jgi:uncharacterized protein YkwD
MFRPLASLSAALAIALSVPARAADEGDPPGAYQAPSPEPSPVETLLLEYINRCRANPVAEAALIRQTGDVPGDVDQAMFEREMRELTPAPPLAFDLALLKSARWHSYYMTQHGLGHEEVEGQAGFTGVQPWDRMQRAGYAGGGMSENAFANGRDPWYSHCGFVVDWGAGPGGMQPERGHRQNIMDPRMRLAGVGAVPYPSGDDVSVTHNFGMSSDRHAGGVVYADANRSGFYDLGEGVEDVLLACGPEKQRTWVGGAFALQIPAIGAKLIALAGGKRLAMLVPDGPDNVKVDIVVNDQSAFARGGKLLETLRKLPDDEASRTKRFGVLVDLVLATEGLWVEDAVLAEIVHETEAVRAEFAADQAEVRTAVAGDDADRAAEVTAAARKKYQRTKAKAWFSDAEIYVEMRLAWRKLGQESATPQVVERTAAAQQQRYSRLTVPEWRAVAAELVAQTVALAGGAGGP